jgi:hypothetical protein
MRSLQEVRAVPDLFDEESNVFKKEREERARRRFPKVQRMSNHICLEDEPPP